MEDEKECVVTMTRKTIAEPIQITFRNLTYSVQIPSDAKRKSLFAKKPTSEKLILKGLTGAFQPGRLTAILGPSGSGKTSLLNVLAGTTTSGDVGGDIYANGRKVSGAAVRLISGFVFQDDLILGTMTVREAILMSIKLRVPNMDDVAAAEKLDEILSLLQLENAADTVIGTATRKGISGGERKRAAIAMEMVTDPSILFLDEPTSGLDSYTAIMVVHTLQVLARSGRTVVAVMHQPSSEIFHMFDDVLIMKDGQVTFFNEAEKAVDYYSSIGYPCPLYTNPADFIFMNILFHFDPSATSTGEARQKADEKERSRLEEVFRAWQQSKLAQELEQTTRQPLLVPITAKMFKFRSSFITQFKYLLKRASKNAMRNKMIVKVKLFQTIFFALLIGLIYLRIPNKDSVSAQIQDITGSLFFVGTNQMFSTSMPTISIFAEERNVFLREHGGGYYGLSAYFFSKIIVELPINIIMPIIFSAITYWMIGLQADVGKFFIYMVVNVLVALCGSALGIMMASFFKRLQIALAVTPAIILPLMMFGGLMVNNGSAPPYFSWIQWISPIKYSFASLVKSQFDGLVIHGQAVGPQQLKALALDGGFSIVANIMMLLVIWAVCTTLAFLSLYRLVNKSNGKQFGARRGLKKELLSEPSPEFCTNSPEKPAQAISWE
ncbi:hypothetical protein K493DRAFT_341060 [Basidiobolus meristosporus CBS 931.73]|uniref:ABC transporter domain-containing protein n=1 Tax=Basidiobolus meristosporus CBS 931.73 TaxID=1314790 RepID=A0A1Y1XST5_9FUNG|nr:hypothetical protein K493DRAFT_341060 [Basidiobolus meristosporus CBS 931.73]|eukprot:ORX88800.1 hypothetical protein K493DRAFT_341060 [Basidiobolus meristosporus CBS 931.73]